MRTSSIHKIRLGKKNVPVKWRDSAWYPRIVVQSVEPRGSSLVLCEESPLPRSADSSPEDVRAISIRRLGRAGGRLRNAGRCQASDSRSSILYTRSRFFPPSRLDNPL